MTLYPTHAAAQVSDGVVGLFGAHNHDSEHAKLVRIMTQRLYYTDAYQTEFDGVIEEMITVAGRPAVVLDQSCFYPTSGGQPFDTGRLADRQVIDVIVTSQGKVAHVLDGPLHADRIGQTVHGAIDWPRRYDHMQQHSGQHLLSQLFYRQFGMETVAVHFGALDSTLDLDATSLDPAQLAEAEEAANELVYAAMPIRAYEVTEAELAQLPLRRPPKVTGRIRIVEIDGFDYSACGGAHVRTTAEIGPLKLVRQERRRGQTRITFLCGKRALADYLAKHRLLTEAAALFSAEISETPRLIERNLAQLKTLQRELEIAQEQLQGYEAAELVAAAGSPEHPRIVSRLFAGRELNRLKGLANQLQQHPNVVALLASSANDKLTIVFARSSELDIHMGNLLRDTLQTVGGKGGGRPDFAQGGLADAALGQRLLDAAAQQIRALIG